MRVEIAVQDVEGARIAHDAGAQRVELCVGLPLGGLTPSLGLLETVRTELPGLQIHVLIRPRPGGFAYSPAELSVMEADIRHAAALGAAGVVLGALTADGLVDTDAVRRLVSAAGGLECTFHRAIDQTTSPVDSLGALQDLGLHRVLSSGGAPTAGQGIGTLRAMVSLTGAVTVMAGGGVRVEDLAALSTAGVRDVHLSAKKVHVGTGSGIPLGNADHDGSSSHQVTDAQQVAAAVERGRSLP